MSVTRKPGFAAEGGHAPQMPYEEFLRAKMVMTPMRGFEVAPEEINPILKPHQRDIVRWAVAKGCAGIFAAFGLGKSMIQLEIARLVLKKFGGRFLIIAPLGVRQEFKRDAQKLGIYVWFIRSIAECDETGIYITNYETVRDGKLDPSHFIGASLDEAAVLRSRGTKTFGTFAFELFRDMRFRFVATATPSPNEYQELLSYAAFLDVADIGQIRTRFFKRNPEKMDALTLHEHKSREFWLWMSEWAVFLQRPSDLGYSDAGYDLPELEVRWHEVENTHHGDTETRRKNGQGLRQGKLIAEAATGLVEAAHEKRTSIDARLVKLLELREFDPKAHRLIWHNLEAERAAIEKALPDAVTIYGTQDLDEREKAVIDFSDGHIQELAAKPEIAGSGCNFQRHCNWAIFLGIGFKFADFIQAIHRIHRFLQKKTVRIDLIYTSAEREVKRVLEQKWQQHKELTANMAKIIQQYGLATAAFKHEITRQIWVDENRTEVTGPNFTLLNNDNVYEARRLEDNRFGLILTSLPFGNQYEYTPSYNDLGHTDTNEHFFEQMDYLTPHLYRALKPGRVLAIHCKDRIVPSGMSGLGFQVLYPFHCDVIRHYQQHGFAFLGMKTIVTDVVRENNQTYRLGWTEQCKDGSRMGVGLPEYLLLFRKPQTDRSKGYADDPVVKDKETYTRSRWQIDAHGFARSNGNRLLTSQELQGMKWGEIYRWFRAKSLTEVYDYQEHVGIGAELDAAGHLPKDFMLLPPQSWHPDVWTDVTRMRTLNGAQSSAGREKHICPLQFDIVERVIEQFSMPGEEVGDPFSGLGTVPYCAVKLGRKGWGCELSRMYFGDSVMYCRQAEAGLASPTLFELEAETLTTEAMSHGELQEVPACQS